MKKIFFILICGLFISCQKENEKKEYRVTIPANTVYLVFEGQDTIKLDVISFQEEPDTLIPSIHTAFIEAQKDSQFMRMNFPIAGLNETLFIGEYLIGDTLQPDSALFGIGLGRVVENTDQSLKALFPDAEFMDYMFADEGREADVLVHIKK
jgi:hypothetical protein